MKRLFALCLLLLVLGLCAHAETLRVDRAGDGGYGSLTEALAAAHDGDEIVLADDTYDDGREDFPILVDKSVSIRAGDGEMPIITSLAQVPAMKITAAGAQVEGIAVNFLSSGIWVLADDVRVSGCRLSLADEQWRTSSCGMWVGGAKRLTLTGNVFSDCGIALAGPPIGESSAGLPVLTGMFEVGEDVEFFTTHTIENNIVNEKPLLYVLGLKDVVFSEPAGQLIAVQCENTTFTGLDASKASIGIELAYCKGVVLDNCIADDAGIFGVYVAKAEDCTVQYCRADRGTHGIDLRAVERCVVSDCAAAECGQGIFFSFGWNNLVSRCEIVNNGTGFFSAGGNNNQMDDCLVEGNQLGLYVQKEASFALTNSTIKGNWNTGARVTHGGFACLNNAFEGNWVATMALDCEPVTYQNNSFVGNKNRALFAKDSRSVKLIENAYAEADARLNEFVASEDVLSR